MKALIPLIFLAAPLAAQTNAVIAYDSFDYPAGNLGFMAGGRNLIGGRATMVMMESLLFPVSIRPAIK